MIKKTIFTLLALCLCGTMWADTIGTDIQQDATTGLYFATVTYDNATTSTVIAIIPCQDSGSSYSVSNLVKNDDGTYALPATVQAEGGEAVALQGVAASAFASALTDTSNPIHLVIPANIINMGQSAFQNCTQIEEVTVEYSETDLDEAHNVTYGNSFSGCSNLKVVTQNRNIAIHRNNAQYAYICFPFADLPSIETVYIGEKVTSLTNNAYNARSANTKLKEVYCYASAVPSLAYQCFLYLADGCTLYVYDELVETFKSDSHYNSDYNLYYGWGDIFTNIVGMGEEPDEEQPEGTLKDVTTGLYFEIDADGVVSIVADASGVYTDDNLVKNEDGSYTFPSYVEDKSGTSGNVTRIDASAFVNSSISGHLVIPATITAVGEKAFQNCTGLKEVTYEYSETALQDESAGNNTGTECFLGCSGVTTVNLNRDITLGHSGYLCAPFCYNTSVTTVYIGEYVTKIPDYMFRNNKNACLTEVYCYPKTVPTTNYDPFGNLPSSGCTLYVPAGCKDTYSSASYSAGSYSGDNATTWGEYFNIVEMGSEESGGTFVCDVDPADNAIISVLWQVIFTNPNGGEILCNDELSETPDFEVCNEFGDIVAVGNYVEATMDGNLEVAQALTFSETDGSPTVIEEEGTYYVSVPANVFVIYDENGKVLYNEAMTLTYTVSADAVEEPNYTLVISPEDGSTLECLSTISISCEDGIMWNTLGWVDIAIYDENGDELDNGVDLKEVVSSTGTITEVILTIDPTITAEGEYTIEIPEGYFLISGTIECKAITLKYTINENAGTETGIRGISINDENVEGIYSTSGQKLNSTAKGVNIILFSDGTVKKIYIK